ncbi:MAG: tetratricopeptide repeat protein [Promethearchaeota archaeon]|nr:MAG: tetratricopeptide repeat protein [Candidatus Lokiarchaeota archaeon]
MGALIISTTLDHLKRSEELFNTGEHDKAYAILSDFEDNNIHTLYDLVSSQLLKIEFLFQQGRYKDVLTIAKNTYQNSLELGKNPLRVDALIWMARALIFLNKLEEAYDLIIKGEEFLVSLPDKISLRYIKSKGFIAFVKGYFYYEKGENDKSLEYLNQSLSLREIIGIKDEIAETLCWIVVNLCITGGNLEPAKKIAERSLVLALESAKKFYIAFSLTSLASAYTYRGNINKCIPLFEESLAIFRELNNKRMIAITLNNVGEKYRIKGDLDRALEYLEESIAILIELGNLRDVACIYDFLIQILIEKGNLNQAEIYFGDFKQLKNKLKDVKINRLYLFLKALLLKKSLRIRNKAKAEEIFNQLLEEKSLHYELTIRILINLCELYLHELKVINNLEVLNDINPLIIKLLDIAGKSNSHWILSETYLLQAKLFLLKFETKNARKFLNQAQEIAENYGIKRLAIKISYEHDYLIHQLNMWQELKKTDSSISKRLDLAGLNQQMEIMLKRRAIDAPKLLDEEPVLLLIISEGGIPVFTQSFIKDKTFEDQLFGGFVAAFNSFINNTFSEGLDRASFGEYTLLMKSLTPFLLCYIYKGQSYLAQNRISVFIEELHQTKEAKELFGKSYDINRIIQHDEVPSLKSIITRIFVDKCIPSMDSI